MILLLLSSVFCGMTLSYDDHYSVAYLELVEECGENSESDEEVGKKKIEEIVLPTLISMNGNFRDITNKLSSRNFLYKAFNCEVKTPPPQVVLNFI